MAHHDRCIGEGVVAVAEKGGLSASTMEFPCLLQGNGNGNAGGISKLEGVRELGYGAFPAQI